MKRARILIIAPFYDRNSTGESWSTYKWIEGLSKRFDTVVLTAHSRNWNPDLTPTAAQEVVNWIDPKLWGVRGRLDWELKPSYAVFYARARRWIKAATKRGEHFDLIHQINPLALRYPCPARLLKIPYIIGPLAGSLPTPKAFSEVAKERTWFRKLRRFDAFRIRWDPFLRTSYSDATAIIGVAPYVRDVLAPCNLRRFELMPETGVDAIATNERQFDSSRPLRLLFVGRIIHTKGILEAIEAIAITTRTTDVTLDILGEGDLTGECTRLIKEYALSSKVKLHGRLPKAEVFQWYDRCDVFLFPSYREPSGNVVFEAMSRGLPVITSSVGGPGYIVTEECGFRVAPGSRQQFINDLAHHVLELSKNRQLLESMSVASRRRIEAIGLWPNKIDQMAALYTNIITQRTDRSARLHDSNG